MEDRPNKKYYRAKEVADYLSIGLSTVWLYARQGKFTPIKLSTRVVVFDIEEVQKFKEVWENEQS